MQIQLTFKYLLTPEGLLRDQTLVVGDTGLIEALQPGKGPADGYLAIPGMPNAHSHAFQRALSGFGEARAGEDSFWSWREAMYRLANQATPEDMFVIAREAFLDMLRGGYTSVAEFHYVHHMPDGRPGPEMARAIIRAAAAAGIHLLLLPVFYQTGGFNKPATQAQRRFVHASIEDYSHLLQELKDVRLGIAPHSLRAVAPETLVQLIDAMDRQYGSQWPIHIHVSEQQREVDECRALYRATPIDLLARTVLLSQRWNLVHATHATETERRLIIKQDATVVLCPVTEAYLGDGLFAADEFKDAGGRFAIGSDSNCRIDAVEELRWLEYGQRLRKQQRARLADTSGLGASLWQRACNGGAAALSEPVGAIAVGKRADLVVLDEQAAPWRGHAIDTLLDALIIGGSRHDISAVYVGGKRLVDHGVATGAQASAREFGQVVARLVEQ
ncbi:MAG TPA: formimidoylglutamate deiminase [Gammaproteobacteria bacterium]|nr:formimidoylglutamate deiminase [Gammaproteobacteria bacterium]